MKRLTTLALVLGILSSGGCAVTQQVSDMLRGTVAKSEQLNKDGKPVDAINVLKTAQHDDPLDVSVDVALARTQTTYVNDEIRQAQNAVANGHDDEALKHLQSALQGDPSNARANQMVNSLRRRAQLRETLKEAARMRSISPDEALARVNGVLAEQPDFQEAIKLRDRIAKDQEKDSLVHPKLADSLRKPVSLNFKSQPLQNIFDVISRMSGVNFVFDKDVQTSTPASIFAAKTTAEDAINLLLRTNQLEKRVLDSKTLLIYPARPDKDRSYKEFGIRTFYLSQADAKSVMAALRQMIKPKEIYVDERTNSVIVRDTPATLEVADRLVRGMDIPQSEVTLDAQILEVNTKDTVDLGVDWPGKIKASVGNAAPGSAFTIGDLLHMHGSDIGIAGDGDGGALQMALNLLQSQSKVKTLANPKIRVRNLEKASINIGEQVPIVTTTVSNGVTSESVSYQNVGLTLKVEPRISLNDEVSVKVSLEASSILEQIPTKTGLIAYTLGTRKAETLMTAHDNEMQVLAGLINNKDGGGTTGIPYLSQIPGLNRVFGHNTRSDDDTEIVLLITPHIERNLALPSVGTSAFMSGTESEVTSRSMTLREHRDSASEATNDGPDMTATIKPADAAPAAPAGLGRAGASKAANAPAEAGGQDQPAAAAQATTNETTVQPPQDAQQDGVQLIDHPTSQSSSDRAFGSATISQGPTPVPDVLLARQSTPSWYLGA